MKATVWLSLAVAVLATAVLSFLVFRDRPPVVPDEPVATVPAPVPGKPAPEATLRPYETTETLREDLRDALAGPKDALAAEVRRVTSRAAPFARTILLATAPAEASPRVRALLVLAAGVHLPDEPILFAYLDDREPVVRKAAALATAYAAGGRAVPLLDGVTVEVGRALPAGTRAALEARLGREEDEGVRGTISSVLGR